MTTMTVSEARANLYRLLDEVAESHKPAIITGKRSNGILISEEDWNSIQETLHLLSIPGMRESIREGLETPIENCSEELHW
jgi:prevent-host-death family protein